MSELTVFNRIVDLLATHGRPFDCVEHPEARTAEQAAAARGTPLEQGTKAILFKYDERFGIFAMSAERAVRSARIRRKLGVRRTRFATREELGELAGLLPGEVPPFGEPVLPFPLFVDPSVLERDSMLFTAGSRTRSIRMATSDYRLVAKPRVFPFVR